MKSRYTQEALREVAVSVLAEAAQAREARQGALVIGLEGDLGAGKTTLVQTLATHCGVTETVTSPTFVIAKTYTLPEGVSSFSKIVHIDAYRIEHEEELRHIGFDALCESHETLVIVEWPSRIREAMARVGAVYFTLTHQAEQRLIEGPFTYEA